MPFSPNPAWAATCAAEMAAWQPQKAPMTDLEISKALALAIGYNETFFFVSRVGDLYVAWGRDKCRQFRKFDYHDWNVIGPIAERYVTELIRCRSGNGPIWWECHVGMEHEEGYAVANGDTPQRAIAMAVIQGAKK